ncbi:two-partner secretion domain-containing protein, partial [Nostoc sp.]|uniref:two-partner secretion domain-containing protein n=1 Tax=Nostoc sp. TaxID=1180 RepID=UPI002FFC14ED
MNQADYPVKASIKSILYLCLISATLSQASPAKAQITPDNTLGAEASQLNQNQIINGVLGDKINGGATRGSNLFHSFSEFNIQDGQRVYFANPASIENILTRVTGGNASNIFGTLGVDGTANLFLINPSGILFGRNARLDVQGSFVGTTANGVQFGNQGIFSATNPKAPPLLTIQPSALWFNQLNLGAGIQNNSVAPAGIDPAGFNVYGLQVPDGKSLLLVGGNVSTDGGGLNAYGGRVELGGLAAPGNVNLLFNEDNFSLKFPLNVTRADVSLTNKARVYVEAAGGGDITINARNLDILEGSRLSAGIGRGLGTPEVVAGDITLNTTGEIKIAGFDSGIINLVRLGAKGKGGNITIDSGDFSLSNGALLGASTFGQGNAGNVTVGAKNTVSFAGNAGILTAVGLGGVGKGGNIDINAATISLTDGALLSASTYGQGNAGNVTVGASNAVSLTGNASILSTVEAEGVGKGGNIDINVATLSFTDGTLLTTSTFGRGNAGNVTVGASNAVSLANASILSTVGAGSVGKGGNIDINVTTLSLTDGAQLSASTYGQGNAGNVTVGASNAISLTGNAVILSTVERGGVGKGGNIDINAATLSLTDGAQLRSGTNTQPTGRGDAGNVNVLVTGAVDIAGQKNDLRSGIFSLVGTGGVGNGGNITIDSGDFSLSNGALLGASTSGQGNAGNVTVGAKNTVSFAGNAGILSGVGLGGVGKGGNIDINAATISLTDGALLGASTSGQGNAGNITVGASNAVSLANASILSTVEAEGVGKSGNIDINGTSLSLTDGTGLTTSTFGRGNAGNITVGASNAVSLANASILSTVGAGSVGKGGNININGTSLSLTDGTGLTTSTLGQGNAGNITVGASNAVSLANAGILSGVGLGGVGKGGNIDINAATLSLTDGTLLTTSTLGQGDAGNMTVNALNGDLSLSNGVFLSASTFGEGDAGNVTVGALNVISLAGNTGVLSRVEVGGV